MNPYSYRLELSVTVGSPSSPPVVASAEGSGDLGDVLRSIDLSQRNPSLRVGAGMVACIREGPGVRFTKAGVEVNSDAVVWSSGRCLLPETCSGRGNVWLREIVFHVDSCQTIRGKFHHKSRRRAHCIHRAIRPWAV